MIVCRIVTLCVTGKAKWGQNARLNTAVRLEVRKAS